MNGHDKKWHIQYEQLVEFKRKHGHCVVPRSNEQEHKSLGPWVNRQRSNYVDNKMRLDRKTLLNEIGFTWKAHGAHILNQGAHKNKIWQWQYERLVEFQQTNGHCRVPFNYEQHKSLGWWVRTQRSYYNHNKLGQDRKRILDDIGFAWNVYTRATPSSPTNVRGLVIGSSHALGRSWFSLSLLFLLTFCVESGVGSVHQQCGSPKRNTR
jgi:hypothetical protein